MREDSLISGELRSYLKLPYRSLLQTSSGVKVFWRSFLDRMENVKRISCVTDFAAFNPHLFLDDKLAMPEIDYRKGHKQSSIHDFEKTELSAKLQGKAAQQGISQSLGKTGSPEKEEQKVSQQINEVNQYITRLLKKSRLHSFPFHGNEDDDQEFLNIFTSAFNRTIQGPQTPFPLLQNEFFLDYSLSEDFNQLVAKKSHLSKGSNYFREKEKDIKPFAGITKGPVEDDQNKFQVEKSSLTTQQSTAKSTERKPKEKNYNINPQGLQLLNTLTQNWITGSNQIFADKNSPAKRPQFPNNVKSGNAKTFQADQEENFKNFINLTVQMQDGKSEDEELETLSEKVNRILMEQARRYGIDLT